MWTCHQWQDIGIQREAAIQTSAETSEGLNLLKTTRDQGLHSQLCTTSQGRTEDVTAWEELQAQPGDSHPATRQESLSLDRLCTHPVGDMSTYLCQLREQTASHKKQWVGKGLGNGWKISIERNVRLGVEGYIGSVCGNFKAAATIVCCQGGCWRGEIQRKDTKKGSRMRKRFLQLSYSACLRKGKRSYSPFR